jgi:rhomboid protease GluP
MEIINEWALVLSSESIPCDIQEKDGRWVISVEESFYERAEKILSDYDRENRVSLVAAEELRARGKSYSPYAVSFLLLAIFILLKLTGLEESFIRTGAASAGKILQGELWRIITALTLHADLLHVLANAFSCWVFCAPVVNIYGSGLGWFLILLAGASGNLITAFIYRTAHTSIGASTSLFGAVGLLGASRCALGKRYRLQGRKTWFYIAGTVTLVAVMGVGENVDVLAHLFGAMMGVIFGFPSARKMSRPSGQLSQNVQFIMGAGTAAVVLLSWICALYLT